jgi:hypothetical protein
MPMRSMIEVKSGGQTFHHPIETIEHLDRAFQRAVVGYHDTFETEAEIVAGHGVGSKLLTAGQRLRIDDFTAWRQAVFGDIPPPSTRWDRYSGERVMAEREAWMHLASANARFIRAWRTVDSAAAKVALENIADACDRLAKLGQDAGIVAMANGRI